MVTDTHRPSEFCGSADSETTIHRNASHMATINVRQTPDHVALKVSGDFTFSLSRDFRDAYKAHPANSRFVVDLSQTDYMDSSSLGMLLQLREYTGKDNNKVSIVGASGQTAEVLKVAQFDSLFKIAPKA